jgi:transcriptional regulator with XRE-family HTH domain
MAWDRVNFGRVLRELRAEAGLTQGELAERMGRDRRRLMVLEQGTAVREPRAAEVALIAAALGVQSAGERLRAAVNVDSLEPSVHDAPGTIHEEIRAQVGSEFSDVLTKLDEARDAVRALARSADHSFAEERLTAAELFRSSRAIVWFVSELHDELYTQTGELLKVLERDGSLLGHVRNRGRSAAEAIAEFKQAHLRYWKRCDLGGIRGQLDPDEEPDHIEVWLDALEAGVFHLHPRTSELASLAIRGYGHLFLIWASLAFEADQLTFSGPGRLSKKVYEERERAEQERQRQAHAHLQSALQKFHDLSIEEFADALLKEEWAAQHRENLFELERIWRDMKELGSSIAADCFERLWGEMPRASFRFERGPRKPHPAAED